MAAAAMITNAISGKLRTKATGALDSVGAGSVATFDGGFTGGGRVAPSTAIALVESRVTLGRLVLKTSIPFYFKPLH